MAEDGVSRNTYEQLEVSVDEALPVEYYLFSTQNTEHRFTSGEFETTFRGEIWQPLQIDRGNIRNGPSDASNLSLTVKIPSSSSFAQNYALTNTEMSVTIYRNYYGALDQDAIIIWTGTVTNFTISGEIASISIPDKLSYFLRDEVPNFYYQSVCNHVLYNQGCGVKIYHHTYTITPTTVSGTRIQFVSQNLPAHILAGGLLTIKRTNETRTIVSNSSNTIDVNYVFSLLEPGDECEAVKGCDHSLETCKTKFKNVKRFGGHPFIPYDNPFIGDID